MHIQVGRYSKNPSADGTPGLGHIWQGWLRPSDGGWVIFVDHAGQPLVFLLPLAETETGAVID